MGRWVLPADRGCDASRSRVRACGCCSSRLTCVLMVLSVVSRPLDTAQVSPGLEAAYNRPANAARHVRLCWWVTCVATGVCVCVLLLFADVQRLGAYSLCPSQFSVVLIVTGRCCWTYESCTGGTYVCTRANRSVVKVVVSGQV